MKAKNQEGVEMEPVSDNLVEVTGEGVNAKDIINRVRRRVESRRQDIGYDPVRFPSYGGVPFPGLPDGDQYDPDLYHHLLLANKIYAQIETQPQLESSPAVRIPVLGRIWSLIRLYAHDLVLFYVNRAVRHEIDVNRHLVSVLNSLTKASREQRETILRLEGEVKDLQSKMRRE